MPGDPPGSALPSAAMTHRAPAPTAPPAPAPAPDPLHHAPSPEPLSAGPSDDPSRASGSAPEPAPGPLAAPPPGPATLEGSALDHAAWLRAAADFVQEHLAGLAQAPAHGLLGAPAHRRARELAPPIPEAPLPGGMDHALALLREAATLSLTASGPGYLAYVPGGGLPLAAIADLLAGACNRFSGTSAAAPGFCRLEADVLDWLAREFGYGPDARGLLTSGGSIANLAAIVSARHHHLGDDADLRLAVAYTSSEAHHSVAKALRLAGLPPRALRQLPVDRHLRIDPAALVAAIADDRRAGRRPFLIIAAAGTTNTGAVDPFPELAAIARREGLWLHADGAYGGAFALCDEGRRRLVGLHLADSITIDPHKGLFLPYGTGCLLVADGERLARAHGGGAAYLQDLEAGDLAPPSPSELGPELSRPFRGLRLWLPLMVFGAGAFRQALTEKLALAAALHAAIAARIAGGAPLELAAPPHLSVVAFRPARRPGEPLAAWNRRGADLLAAIHRPGRVLLSSTLLPGDDGPAYTLRACVLSLRTHRDRIDALLADLDRALAELT